MTLLYNGFSRSSAGHSHVLICPDLSEQQGRWSLRRVDCEAVEEARDGIIMRLGVGVEDEDHVVSILYSRDGDCPHIVTGWGDGRVQLDLEIREPVMHRDLGIWGASQAYVVQPDGQLDPGGGEASVRCLEAYLEVSCVEVYRPVVLQGGGDVVGDDGPRHETVDDAEVEGDCHDEEQPCLGLGT